MIDTMKFKVHLMPDQYPIVTKGFLRSPYKNRQGELKQTEKGEIILPPYSAKLTLLLYSDHPETLYIEGSLPKLWYGENVHLLYPNQLEPLLELIYMSFIRRYGSFPHYSIWEVQRLDVCYAWKFESQAKATEVLRYVQTLEYPRKNKHPYGEESVDFGGSTSKIKFYLKLPEFKKNGSSSIQTNDANQQFVDCLKLAEGVLRYEITFRRKALKSMFKKKSITFKDCLDESKLMSIMTDTLSMFQGDTDIEFAELQYAAKNLSQKYKLGKTGRLLTYLTGYHSAPLKVKKLIKRYSNSSDLSANNKAIKDVNILLPHPLDIAPFKFSIPSDLVVNLAPEVSEIETMTHKLVGLLEPEKKEEQVPNEESLPF